MNIEEKIITKIEVQKNSKERVNVYINNEFAFACNAELIYVHGLSRGKIIDIEHLEEIINEDFYLKCKSDAIRSVEKAYKTEKQVYDKLVQKGYSDRIIKRTIEFLKEYNFINDEKFVRMYINDKLNSRGKNRIRYELLRKGIDEGLLEENFNNIDKDIEESTAIKLAEKKYRLLTKSESDNRKIYRKLGDYLVKNGYNLDIVQKTLNTVIIEETKSLNEELEEEKNKQIDIAALKETAKKRYEIIIKSENNTQKIYKRLGDYLLRRGYSWESIKPILKEIID